VAALVHGRSGIGKSRLVQHFLAEVGEQHRAVVLSGKCYERESVPYKALDSLIDSLSRYLGTLSSAEVEAILPREVRLLTRLFPVLNRVPAVARAPGSQVNIVDPLQSRRRAFAALRELLARLGDRQPLVLFVDDLQWGDAESATALADLLAPPEPPVFLLVGSYRSEELDTSDCLKPLLAAWERVLHSDLCSVPVDPLPVEEAAELAIALAGGDVAARQRASEIARESRGNPFFVQVLVQSMGALADGSCPAAGGGNVALDDVLWQRMQRLPGAARGLLETIAVSGQPLTISEASRAAGLAEEAHAVLAQLRYERLVRGAGAVDWEEIETYHDRVRETILERLEPATLRDRHLRLAVALEEAKAAADGASGESATASLVRSQERRLFSLAYHFDAAGEGLRALPYALSAAGQARSRHALQIAEQQYRIAERGAVMADQATRYGVAEGLGEVLMLSGKYGEAERSFTVAMETAPNTLAQAQAGGKLGEVAFKRGDLPACSAAVEGALRQLGMYVPRRNWMFGLLAAREGTVQLLHTLFPRRFLARRSLAGSESEFAAIRLYSRLGYCYWFLRGRIPCFWAHLRDMNLAERYPPTPELAQAYSEHGPAMGMTGLFERGIAYSQKSLAMRRDFGDVWGQGQTLHFYCVVLYACGRFEECIERGREADRLLEQTGDPWERNSARYQVARSLYRLGRLAEARDVAWQFHESAVELGDTQGAAMSLDVWTLASRGRVSAEIIQTELACPSDDVQRAAQVMLAEAVRLLAENQPTPAVELLGAAVDRLGRGGISNAYVTPVHAWYATALRKQALTYGASSRERREILAQARRAVRRATRLASTFQNDLPHCRREAALLSALRGRGAKARELLDESLAIAKRQGAQYEVATTMACRGSLGQQFGWADAARDLAEARTSLRLLGVDESL
jgi:two-component system sensor kinase